MSTQFNYTASCPLIYALFWTSAQTSTVFVSEVRASRRASSTASPMRVLWWAYRERPQGALRRFSRAGDSSDGPYYHDTARYRPSSVLTASYADETTAGIVIRTTAHGHNLTSRTLFFSSEDCNLDDGIAEL